MYPDIRLPAGIGLTLYELFLASQKCPDYILEFLGKAFYWIAFLPFKKLKKKIKNLEILHLNLFLFFFFSSTPCKNLSQYTGRPRI